MIYIKDLKKEIVLALIIIFGGAVIITVLFLLVPDTNDGRAYKSRQALCFDFAQSYLRTISKTEGYNNEKWAMAIDVETDLYNLCSLNLNEESLKNFQLSALEKYKQ